LNGVIGKNDFDHLTSSDLDIGPKFTQNLIDCSLDYVQSFHKVDRHM